MNVPKLCTTCRRFRSYDLDDRFCIVCGNEGLEDECECGRRFDYALAETGPVHCPRCGKSFHGRSSEYE